MVHDSTRATSAFRVRARRPAGRLCFLDVWPDAWMHCVLHLRAKLCGFQSTPSRGDLWAKNCSGESEKITLQASTSGTDEERFEFVLIRLY